MTAYAEYFLNSHSSIVQLETMEFSHPNFTKTYYVIRNAVEGINLKLETGATQFFEYYPCKISSKSSRDDLDSVIQVVFGDLGEILPKELDYVMSAGAMLTKPTVKYRVYRSDDVNAPIYGPLFLEVSNISFDKYGATFEAKAPSLNQTETGQRYTYARFPTLRGFT